MTSPDPQHHPGTGHPLLALARDLTQRLAARAHTASPAPREPAAGPELGAWLRCQRETRGWARREMARQLITAARASGDTSAPGIDSVTHYIYRWEKSQNHLTDRYRLHYCRALHIAPSDFGPAPAPSLAALPALLATHLTRWLEAHASQARPAGTTGTTAQPGTANRDNRAPTTAR